MRRVRGVRAIADEIEVRYPFEEKIDDDEIAKRAVDVLGWNSVVPERAIQVLVRNGWVTLTGNVVVASRGASKVFALIVFSMMSAGR